MTTKRDIRMPNQNVVSTWNKKRELPASDLSQIVPFMNLISLYKSEDIETIRNSVNSSRFLDFRNNLSNYNIINDRSGFLRSPQGETVQGAELANLQSQLDTRNGNIRQTGGVGLMSMNVDRGSDEAFNIKIDVKLTITDPNIFDTELRYNSLVTLNSNFLIVYGWSFNEKTSNHPQPVINPGANTTSTIDLEAYRGDWAAYVCKLYKYDFTFDQTGQLECNIQFMAVSNSILTYMQGMSIANKIIENVEDDKKREGVQRSFQYQPQGVNKPPKIIKDKDDNIVYVSLAFALENLSSIIKEESSTPAGLNFTFADINVAEDGIGGLFSQFVDSAGTEDDKLKQRLNEINLTTAGHMLISYDEYQAQFNENTPVLDIIRNILSSTTTPGIILSTRTIGSAIEIFVASVDDEGIKRELEQSIDFESGKTDWRRVFQINYGQDNSLCESIDMTSKMDPNAFDTYNIPMFLNNGSINISTVITGLGLANEFREFSEGERARIERENKNAESNTPVLTTNTLASRFISSNPEYYNRFVTAIMASGNIFTSLLGYYLKRTSITIHGTANLYAYNYIIVTNLVRALGGIYNIVKVTDQVDYTGFRTILEAVLVKPMEQFGEPTPRLPVNADFGGGGGGQSGPGLRESDALTTEAAQDAIPEGKIEASRLPADRPADRSE